MKTIDVLDRAVDQITRGWVQGKMIDPPRLSSSRRLPRVCMLGSLQAVEDHRGFIWTCDAAEAVEAKQEAQLLIVRAISELHPNWNRTGAWRILNIKGGTSEDRHLRDQMSQNFIANFNDSAQRQWSEVLQVMIRARELANDTLIASNVSAIEADLATAGD